MNATRVGRSGHTPAVQTNRQSTRFPEPAGVRFCPEQTLGPTARPVAFWSPGVDRSGFVASDDRTDRITGVGQVFRMNMTGLQKVPVPAAAVSSWLTVSNDVQ